MKNTSVNVPISSAMYAAGPRSTYVSTTSARTGTGSGISKGLASIYGLLLLWSKRPRSLKRTEVVRFARDAPLPATRAARGPPRRRLRRRFEPARADADVDRARLHAQPCARSDLFS